MTAENNGVPEDNDPFAYLYRPEGGDGSYGGSEAPTQQQGVPRTSYAQATQVGRTQYGQARHQPGGYGYPQQPPMGAAPTQAVPQQQGYVPPPGGGRAAARGGGGGGRGVAIGAVAVVVAIVIGIGVAMFTSGGDKNKTASGGTPTAAASGQSDDTASPSPTASASTGLPIVSDADTMQISGAQVMGDHTGAKSKDGKFVATMNPGASITWTVTVPSSGQYQLWIRYANAGGDTSATVTANGTARSVKLPNYTKTDDWNNAWYYYWTIVNLNAGANTVQLSSAAGQGNYNVDQLAVTTNCNSSTCKPSAW